VSPAPRDAVVGGLHTLGSTPSRRQVDVRGPRFGAWVTTVVLAIALALHSSWLLGAQTVVFGLGAALGLRFAPYGAVFRLLVAPRLGPVREREDEAPPRFAQAVGFVFALAGTLAFAFGATPVGVVAAAFALAAAFLNAAFGLCLGCVFYLRLVRFTHPHQKEVTV
jgi:hypothetical protein